MILDIHHESPTYPRLIQDRENRVHIQVDAHTFLCLHTGHVIKFGCLASSDRVLTKGSRITLVQTGGNDSVQIAGRVDGTMYLVFPFQQAYDPITNEITRLRVPPVHVPIGSKMVLTQT
jgi:hypothetical protein